MPARGFPQTGIESSAECGSFGGIANRHQNNMDRKQSENEFASQAMVPVASTPPVVTEVVPETSGEFKLPLGLSKRRLAVAFAIAGVSDLISAFASFLPPAQWALDFITAIALFLVLGWRWLLLPGLVMEAIPGVGVFPFWVLVVGAIAVAGQIRPKLN